MRESPEWRAPGIHQDADTANDMESSYMRLRATRTRPELGEWLRNRHLDGHGERIRRDMHGHSQHAYLQRSDRCSVRTDDTARDHAAIAARTRPAAWRARRAV